jgi:hypothetical protein
VGVNAMRRVSVIVAFAVLPGVAGGAVTASPALVGGRGPGVRQCRSGWRVRQVTVSQAEP